MTLTDIATIIGSILTFVTLLAGTYKWAHAKGFKEGRGQVSYARDLDSLQHLYAPLVSLFLDVHISACTLTKYPTFSQRFKHAVSVFQERRFLKSKLKRAFLALFDKGVSEPSVGTDYGSRFPTGKIEELLKRQTHLAQPALIRLYRSMSREEYERGGMSEDELSACHLEFVDHVFAEHERLANRIRGGR
jgi:hypothetical protein